jgi:GGDEF domain-containing protein
MDLEIEILDRLYSVNENFIARTSQELRRAQRYLDFVSFLSVDASHIKESELNETNPNGEFYRKLRRHIRNAIRQTDVISGFSKGKICVLLVDTPGEGVKSVSDRLQESIRYFLHEIINSPRHWRVEIHSDSFPGDGSTANTFLSKIRAFLD